VTALLQFGENGMFEVTGTNVQIARELVEAIAEADRKALSALLRDDVARRFSGGTAFPADMVTHRQGSPPRCSPKLR
jgi:hypothetical protein